jgi:hypothetical protein
MGREKRGRNICKRHEKRRESEGCKVSFPKPIFYIKTPSECHYNSENVKRRNKGNVCWSSFSFQRRVRKQIGCQVKGLNGQNFRISPKHICRKAFLFANLNILNHLWDKDKICAGKDWFSGVMKRN